MTIKDKIPTPLQVAIKYGVYSSLLLIAVLLVLYYSDRHPLMIPVIFDVRIFLLAIFIFFAIREFREVRNNGIAHFWQGLIIGLGLAFIMGLMAALFIMVFGAFEEQFLTEYVDKMTLQLSSNKERALEAIGEEAYNHNLSTLPTTSLGDLAFDYYAKTMFISIFLTIIIAIILRRQPSTQLNTLGDGG